VSVTLRPMRWWDVESALEIEREVFSSDAWTAEQFWSELAGVPATRWYVVATAADDVVGYAGLAQAGSECDVQTLAVRRSRQGSGVGSMLLDALLAEGSRRGCARAFLEVRADNAAAIALYRRRGFERIAVRQRYYSDGTDALVMRGRIGPREP
jgi:[ribosomal protein S18]-alanine N-acetyltransferase